jgi:hypothetical protein
MRHEQRRMCIKAASSEKIVAHLLNNNRLLAVATGD